MKRQLLLGCVLSSLLSANSFALDIHGGKLISHKEWTKGNVVNSSFKEVTPSKEMNGLDQNAKDGHEWISAQSTTYQASSMQQLQPIKSIPVNTDIDLNGYSEARISNSTNAQSTFTIHSVFSVAPPCLPHMLCPMTLKIVEDVVTLDPNGYVTMGRTIGMTVNFNTAGEASYQAGISVSNDSKSTIFNTLGDTKYIQVTDQKK